MADVTEPVKVTIIGTGDGTMPETGTVMKTPEHKSNLVVVVVPALVAISVRFFNLFLITLLGLIGGEQIIDVIPPMPDGMFLESCAKLAFWAAALGLGKDLVTVFGRLEQKYPLLTGSI